MRSCNFPRLQTLALFAAPPLVALILYWPGLTSWFQKDDFIWLGLNDMVQGWRDVPRMLFHPFAQGTIRTLSERVFFSSLYAAFGLHALPYRLAAFITYALASCLLIAVCGRLTGSRAAGMWAALFWTVNSIQAVPFSWTAVYHEWLCSVVFLLALWFLIRYAESGRRRDYIWQWAVYLAGFGVIESNVVYPAIAAVYALCCARHALRSVLPMFIPAGLYTWLHLHVAPLQTSGPYQMHWDSSVFATLSTFWKMALGPNRLIYLGVYPSLWRSAAAAVMMAGLAGFLLWQVRRGRWVTVFFAAWFLIALAPVLPLRDHVEDYYLTVPLIGLAMWGGWALACAWRAGLAARVGAVLVAATYLAIAIPIARVSVDSMHARSVRILNMVAGVGRLAPRQSSVLLTGVDSDLFWSGVYFRPFRFVGIPEVLVAPELRDAIGVDSRNRQFFADHAAIRKALEEGRATVLDVSGGQVRDVTAEYRAAR